MKIKAEKTYIFLIEFLLYWISFQEFFLPIFYKITNSQFLTNILFYSKDLILLILFIWALYKNFINKKFSNKLFSYIFIVLIVILLTFIYENTANLTWFLQGIRQVILLPAFALIGIQIKDKEKFYKFIINNYFKLLLAFAIFGIGEYYADILVGTKEFWKNTLGFTKYYLDIKKQAATMVFGLPGNFYGSYGGEFFSVKRLVSFWAVPLTSAYILIMPTIYYFLQIVKKQKLTKGYIKSCIKFLIFIFALWLTHTRAMLLCFLICASFEIFKNRKLLFAIGCICALFVIVYKSDTLIKVLYDGSTVGHIIGITGSLSYMDIKLFGNGFGYVGVLGGVGTESTYLSILGNLGIVGLLTFLILYYSLCLPCLKNMKNNTFIKTIAWCAILYAISGFISEQLLAYTSIAPFYLFFGFTFGLIKINTSDVKKEMNLQQVTIYNTLNL